MGSDNRQTAYKFLIHLADKQGYVTFDEIMDCSDKYNLPIQDFDWLSNSITSRGILVYDKAPSSKAAVNDEYDDYAQSDYDEVYHRIVELNPSLEPLVKYVKNIVPPQFQEINKLKYQVVDGNSYARIRMIEMYLRAALKVALQRAEAYDIEIEDTIGYACMGLITAVDRYNPDISGAFLSYATLWVMQNIAREQSTLRPLIYYPVHQRESFFTMYPILKDYGCIGCDRLRKCKKARRMAVDRLACSDTDAETVISQMIPDLSFADFINTYSDEDTEEIVDGILVDADEEGVSSYMLTSGETVFQQVDDRQLEDIVSKMLKTLKPREAIILRLRYGFDGPQQSLEEIGHRFNLTRERVRQIEAKALAKLRSPSALEILIDYY